MDRAAKKAQPKARKGISLIEMGIAMLFISLALVPIVQMVGGAKGSDGSNVARVTGNRSKELIMANALVERALSRDYSVLNCTNAAPTLPVTSQLRTYSMCTNSDYTTPMYYQWTVRNMGASVGMPIGNELYQAVLNVYDKPQNGQLRLTLPTYIFNNIQGFSPPGQTTGIAIVLDVSGSMAWANVDGGLSQYQSVASPYLKYRYRDPAYPAYVPPGTVLDLTNNAQLDIVSAQDGNNPATAWDDRYLKTGVLGMSDCDSPANYNSNPWDMYFHLGNNTHRDVARRICRNKGSQANWESVMGSDMSRIEAARSSLLSLLLDLEADPTLYNNIRLGFTTFSDNVNTRVPLEKVGAGNRYTQMRRSLSWLNRHGNGMIPASGGTNLYEGVRAGAQMVFSDPTLDNRIIFIVGDGDPRSPYVRDQNSFRNLADSIASGTFPGANGKSATIFSLGVIAPLAKVQPFLKNSLADRTPGGQFFYAQNVAELDGVFSQIKYQLQRVVLISRANRYGIQLE